MKLSVKPLILCVSIALLAAGQWQPLLFADEPAGIARFITSKLRWDKGIALDLGPGDCHLAIEIARHSKLTIHAVEPEWEDVLRARAAVDAADLRGARIIVHQGRFEALAYPSCSANLVICGDQFTRGLRERDAGEIYRVLSPNGLAVIGQSAAAAKKGQRLTREALESWLKAGGVSSYEIVEQQGIWALIKRVPSPGWDDWTHRNHDPANTLASNDHIPYAHYRPQWVSDYRPALASAGIALADGRLVVAGLAYPDHPETTPYIQVLDAFTGVELWAKIGKEQLPIDRPPGMYSNREFCSDYAVAGDKLYLLGGKFCHVIDLESGEILHSLPLPAECKPQEDDVWLYLSCVGDRLYGGMGKSPNVKVDWNTMNYRGVSKAVFSLDRRSGKLQWVSHTPASTASLTVSGESFYLCDERLNLHALDAQTGKPRWSTATGLPEGSGIAGCAYYGERLWLLYVRPIPDRRDGFYSGAELLQRGHNRRELAAFSPADGRKLFDCDFGMTVAGFTFSGDTVYGMHQHSSGLAAVDIATGKQKWKQSRWSMKCTASLATPNCLIYRSTETSILDLGSMESENGPGPQKTSFGGFRPTCTFAAVPANGMLYIQAPGCRCPSPIRGSMAIAPGEPPVPIEPDQRLVRGEAYGRPVAEDRQIAAWATWRGDRHRSGQAAEPVALPLKPAWSARLSGSLTPLSAGHGRVYCGNDEGQLVALDLRTGQRQWQYLVGTAIQAAPYLWQGRMYLGDEDGWVHCVRADDGKAIWRFHAALAEDRTVGYGRYASLWPVASGVLVHDGVAYCAAGLLPNEGAVAYALDASTGELKWREEAQQGRRNYRTALVPGGAMAMSQRSLFIPTKQAAPWQIDLTDDKRTTRIATPTLFGSRRGGPQIMTHGEELISVAQGKQYVWHVKYVSEDTTQRLPLIDKGAAYFANRRVSRAGSCLVALAHSDDKNAKPQLLWHAWPDEPMNVMVQAADVIFSGGEKGIYATAAGDGEQLWNAPSPSEITDLACCDGRLVAICRSGEILCFASPKSEKK